MPKFSNQLLQGLTNPTYGDKLNQVGMLVGSAPRRAREAEQQQSNLSSVMAIAAQAKKDAQDGNVAKAQQGQAQLNAALAQADSPEQQVLIGQQITQLNSFMVPALVAAKERKKAEEALLVDQKRRESLAAQATKLNLTSLAKNIIDGSEDLNEAAEFLRGKEDINLATKMGDSGRRSVAASNGITSATYDEMGMAKWTDAQMESWVKGHKAEGKAYQDASGKNVILRTSNSGLVRDPVTGNWVNPSDLALQPAVGMQKVHNVSNKLVEELGMASIANFTELYTASNDAQSSVDNIDRVLPLVESMPTGIGAEAKLLARRIAGIFGDDPDAAVANSEVYLAEMAERVAKEIKAFGSGTGLSDKDREFTENMVAGSITATPEAIIRILKIRKGVAQKTIGHFNTIKESVRGRLNKMKQNGDIVDDFVVRPASVVPVQEETEVLEWTSDGGWK